MLTHSESVLLESFRAHFPQDEVLDVGPARADLMIDGSRPKDAGILIVCENTLVFYGNSSTMFGMAWEKIADMEQIRRLAGAKLRVTLETGGTAEFYMGKVYSTQLKGRWLRGR